MDTKIQDTEQVNDEQELAEVLAGVSKVGDDNLEFEETPMVKPYTQSDQINEITLPEPSETNIEKNPNSLTPDIPSQVETVLPNLAVAPVDSISDTVSDYQINEQKVESEVSPVYNSSIETNDETIEQPINNDVISSNIELPTTSNNELDGIKRDALLELRPLVDKLSLAPEERFDIYLLLLRSTDDKTLISPAYKAAQEIPEESRRAQALLDIVKEIDYLSNQQQVA